MRETMWVRAESYHAPISDERFQFRTKSKPKHKPELAQKSPMDELSVLQIEREKDMEVIK